MNSRNVMIGSCVAVLCFWMFLPGGEAEARRRARHARASARNRAARRAYCKRTAGCVKCSTPRGCGVGFKAIKHFGGFGINYHACGNRVTNLFAVDRSHVGKICAINIPGHAHGARLTLAQARPLPPTGGT